MKLANKRILSAFIATAALLPTLASACQEFTSSSSAHVSSGRAQACGFGGYYACTIGSGEQLGYKSYTFDSITVAETSPGYFEKGNCPAQSGPGAPTVSNIDFFWEDSKTIVVTGNATDPDNDVDHVTLGAGFVGTQCEGTDAFTCRLNMDDVSINAGTQVQFEVTASDSGYRLSPTVTFNTVTPAAPELVVSSYFWDGHDFVVTGTASDISGDLSHVSIGAGVLGVQCATSGEFECRFNAQDLAEGTQIQFEVLAVDDLYLSSAIILINEVKPHVEEQAASACVQDSLANHLSASRVIKQYSLYYENNNGVKGAYLGYSATSAVSLMEMNPGQWVKVSAC